MWHNFNIFYESSLYRKSGMDHYSIPQGLEGSFRNNQIFTVFLFFNFLFYLITFVNIVSTVWPWQPHDKRGKVCCHKNSHSYQCLDKVLSSVCQYDSKSLCLLTLFLIPIGFFWNFAWSWCILLVRKWQNGIFQKNNSSKIGLQGLIVWCVLFLP